MNTRALIQLGSELLFTYRFGTLPADRALSQYLRERRFLGGHDKKFLSETFYRVLRNLRRYDEAIASAYLGLVISEPRYSAGFPVTEPIGQRAWASHSGPRDANDPDPEKASELDRLTDSARIGIAAIELGLEEASGVSEELIRAWPDENIAGHRPPRDSMRAMTERAVEVAALYANSTEPSEAERRYSLPAWLWTLLAEGRHRDEVEPLAAALNAPAFPTFRINTLKTKIQAAHESLRASGLEFTPGERCATAVVLKARVAPAQMPARESGWLEPQDEGSQLVGEYCGAKPGLSVIDACAGGGGKSLQLAAIMGDHGSIRAFDLDPDRLAVLSRRAPRAGATIIDTTGRLQPGGAPPEGLAPADLVLLDSPCSGVGSMRRAPDSRWRLTAPRLETLRATQAELLRNWAPYVKPGGVLVYVTCSLLYCENQAQVEAFLSDHPEFTRDAADLELDPVKSGTDGFYAARLRRKA